MTPVAAAIHPDAHDLRPRSAVLTWMASFAVAAGQIQAAEGYLLELVAFCAFGDREIAASSVPPKGIP